MPPPAPSDDALAALPPGAVLAVGAFDGLHLGHRALLAATLAHARAARRRPAILTFVGSPRALLRPENAPGAILDRRAFILAIRALAPDAAILFQPFTLAFAATPAETFAHRLRGAALFCGEDWRFGAGAEGDPAFLRARGFDVRVVPYAQWRGGRISSTRIRGALAEGRIDDAAAMLGRPWSFTGTVVRGRGLAGPSLGVPTANIPYRGRGGERMAPLAHGVYRAVAQVGGRRWPALLNFGTAPSVKGLAEPLFEAHLLGASGDLYGAEITLSLAEPRLRPERAFPTLEALRAQIRADLEACR